MKKQIIITSAALILLSCMHGLPVKNKKVTRESTILAANELLSGLEVREAELKKMRSRRGEGLCPADTAAVRISAKDLYSLMGDAEPSKTDSFVFYFVKYSSEKDKERYESKDTRLSWKQVKGSSSLLVGLAKKEDKRPSMFYDLATLCPPPPGCGCEAER